MFPKREHSISGRDNSAKRTKTSDDVADQRIRWTLPSGNDLSNQSLSATAQYPILEHIVAHLRPRDLIPLAQTSQAVYADLNFDQPASHVNLLKKTLGPGHGVKIRKEAHPHGGTWCAFNLTALLLIYHRYFIRRSYPG
jgi:hypothetical protein